MFDQDALAMLDLQLAAQVNENASLRARQQELLATIAQLSRETPYPEELKGWEAQRGAMIAEVGSLRARVADAGAVASGLTARYAILEQQFDAMEAERDAALSRCAAAEAERDEARALLDVEHIALRNANASINHLDRCLGEARARCAALEAERENLRAVVAEKEDDKDSIRASLAAARERCAILEQQALADATQLQAMDAERAELHAKLDDARMSHGQTYKDWCDAIIERNAARRHATEASDALEQAHAKLAVVYGALKELHHFVWRGDIVARAYAKAAEAGHRETTDETAQVGALHSSVIAALASDAGSALLDELRLLREALEAINGCISWSDTMQEWVLVGRLRTGPALQLVRTALDAQVKP